MSAAKSPEPYPGAVPLDGMPEPRIEFDPDRRRAFGSVPRLLGVSLELAIDLTAEDRQHGSPEYLHSVLYTNDGKSFNGLALNSVEYSAILLSPETFETRLSARAEKAHRYSNPARREEAKIHAPLHAYQDPGRVIDQQRGLITSLSSEAESLSELQRYIRARGYAQTTESRIRQLATMAWQGSFDNILRVARDQEGWTTRQFHGAGEALAAKLFTGPQADRVASWGKMTSLALIYAKQKRALLTQRNHVAESRVKILKKKEAEVYERYGIGPVA